MTEAAPPPAGPTGTGATEYAPPLPYPPQPPAQPPFQAAAPPGTERLAKIAFICALLGFLALPALLAIRFGIVALTRIRSTGRGGKGLAIAALVISALWLGAWGVFIWSTSAHRDGSGAITNAGSLDAHDLKLGDCLTKVPEGNGDVKDVNASPCKEAHVAEVYLVKDLPAGTYPGAAAVDASAQKICQDGAPDAKDPRAAEYQLLSLMPSEDGWGQGDHSVVCAGVVPTPIAGKFLP